MNNQKARHSNIERRSIFKTGDIVESMGWIFREQMQVDVGIDGIIEQSENGNPTGNFIAVQVKSGEEALYESKKGFTYYISNVHYEYWLNLSMPIIIIYYNPDNEKLYWKSMNKTTVSKTRKQWKIEIPKRFIFSTKTKDKLTKIINTHKVKRQYVENSDEVTFFDILESGEYINDVGDSMDYMLKAMDDFSLKMVSVDNKLNTYLNEKLSWNSPPVIAQAKRCSNILEVLNSRVSRELEIFGQSFSGGIMGTKKLLELDIDLEQKVSTENEKIINTIRSFPDTFKGTIANINTVLTILDSIPEKYESLKKVKAPLIYTIKCLKVEFEDATYLCNEFTNFFDGRKNG